MTQQQESVVTPERFASGLTWEQYLAHIKRNVEKFEYNYRETVISDDDARALRDLAQKDNGPAKVMALGEDWCPDVFRGLPVIARVAEAAGMELRVFFRDQNKDIMAEFLHHGEHESIPTFVFYTRDHKYIAHWIERPALAQEEMSILRAINEPLRNPDLSAEERQKHIQAYVDFQHGPTWAGWRQATIKEIRALLEQHCG